MCVRLRVVFVDLTLLVERCILSLLLMSPPRVWLSAYPRRRNTVTGASSGLGKALTEAVLRKGELRLLPLDVTRPSDITAAFTRTQKVFGRLDVVFNNAGHGMIGEVESIPDADARAV